MKITVEQVDNGWIVTAGCMRLVFTDAGHLGQQFYQWLTDPLKTEAEYIKKYQKDPMNRLTDQPVMGTEEVATPYRGEIAGSPSIEGIREAGLRRSR